MNTSQIYLHFNPVQPSVKTNSKNITYTEFSPKAPLQEFIHCYWQLKTKQTLLQPYYYRVVSDGCIDIFFNLKYTDESFVMGFCKKYTEFSIGTDFNYAGIRFYPSAFSRIFEISAKIVSDKDQALKTILPKVAEFIIAKIHPPFSESLFKLDNFFQSLLQDKTLKTDSRFQAALMEILKRKGNLETETDLNIGLSPRQLRRLFNYYIGTTPKSFCQVVRFQYILNAKPSIQSLKQNKIFYDVGFYDQAHFIKNFTTFYGITPTKAFQ